MGRQKKNENAVRRIIKADKHLHTHTHTHINRDSHTHTHILAEATNNECEMSVSKRYALPGNLYKRSCPKATAATATTTTTAKGSRQQQQQ